MAQRRTWPWVIGALILGYIVGGTTEPSPTVSAKRFADDNVTIAIKSDRVFQPAKPKAVVPNVQAALPVKRPEKTAPVANPKKSATTAVKPSQPFSTFKVRTMYVDATRLNVRAEPEKTAKQIWTLKNNQAVKVTQENGEWLFVEGDRYKGWVFGTYLTNKPAPSKTVTAAKPTKPKLSDANIRQLLIRRSIALYSGRCPCPYNVKSNGHRCGGNSAYSRPGGAEPLCYDQDITAGMIADYRARN